MPRVDRDVQELIGQNEGTFREINEGIKRGGWPGEEDAPLGFRCECARLGCNLVVEVTGRDYERIRSNPRRFFVAPGHQHLGAERVVETRPNYLVVEKDGAGGEMAEETDPRD
jgi:hypothetical protein